MKSKHLLRSALLLLGLATVAQAVTIFNPSNGHYYEAVSETVLWSDANREATSATFMGLRGHLATITSKEEQDFIIDNVVDSSRWWLGAFQSTGANSPGDGWQWVTGEPFLYANWFSGEPNDGGDDVENNEEDYMELILGRLPPQWNDIFNDRKRSYIVEYQAAEPIRDQGRIYGTAGVLLLGTDQWSQSITTGFAGQLSGIQIQFHHGLPEPALPLTLSIFAGGNPTSGRELFSEKLYLTDADLDPDNTRLFTWDLSRADLMFKGGDVFSFGLQAEQTGYEIAGNNGGYHGGELFKDQVASSEVSDIAFITYVTPVPRLHRQRLGERHGRYIGRWVTKPNVFEFIDNEGVTNAADMGIGAFANRAKHDVFKGWVLDFDNRIKPREDGRFEVASNLIIADKLASGGYWKVKKSSKGHTVQATAGEFKNWYLDFYNNAEVETQGGSRIANNLILSDKLGSGGHWEITKTGRGYTIRATSGNFVGWHLDIESRSRVESDGRFQISRSLRLVDRAHSGAYWNFLPERIQLFTREGKPGGEQSIESGASSDEKSPKTVCFVVPHRYERVESLSREIIEERGNAEVRWATDNPRSGCVVIKVDCRPFGSAKGKIKAAYARLVPD